MRTATRLVVATVAGGLLAGCSVGIDQPQPAAPTSSPEVTAPDGSGDATGEEGAVDDEAGPTEEIATGDVQTVQDVVASIPTEPLPEVAPATGAVVTSGSVSVVVPPELVAVGTYDGVHLFEGPAIPGARGARAGMQVYPPVVDPTWAQRLGSSLSPGLEAVTSTVYSLDVPGADAAVVHVVTDPVGHGSPDREGRRVWQPPVTTAHVLVGVGDQVTRIVLQTTPTAEGLDTALAVARTVTVAAAG
jgi:hypothetical protein